MWKGQVEKNYDLALAAAAGIYALANTLCLYLASNGTISPPWRVYDFFALIGPPIGLVIVVGLQMSRLRPFTWAAVCLFSLAMTTAAWITLQMFASARAATLGDG